MSKLIQMPLFTIARLCEQETHEFWQKKPHDPQYCYALWQRALSSLDDSQIALEFVYRVYIQQIRLWVKAHRLFSATTLSDVDLADMAFGKIWKSFANDAEKIERFPDDPHAGLPKLLSFLKLCVHSVVTDQWRKQSNAHETELDESSLEVSASEIEQLYDPLQFWQCVEARFKDDVEEIVIAATFLDGLRPRMVAAQFPEHFKDAQQVSQIKTRVFRRLRNDASFQACLDGAMHENR